jgi:hypothetical protein
MSLMKTETPQTLGSFAAAFTQALNNFRDQSQPELDLPLRRLDG